MAFTKVGDSESSRVISGNMVAASQVFQRIGKSSATELEILRAARDLGVDVTPFSLHFTRLDNGRYAPKEWDVCS